jgi:alkylation response protein AidB-like acyl-CoA dehydrogenase
MSDLILEQFTRLLDGLDPTAPWGALEASGFLDLLRPESEGGAGLDLEALFPLALETGRRPLAPPVVETMAARLLAPEASHVSDLEAALKAAGGDDETARALAAAVTAARMAGAMERLQEITLDWAATRKQFGREIGKFQAIQHQIAVLAEEVTAARMAAQMAFAGPPLSISPRRAGLAKLRTGEAAQAAAAIAHAVHGAIGVSQEHPLHHYTGALHHWRLAHGGEAWWARRLGQWALTSDQDMVSLARAV